MAESTLSETFYQLQGAIGAFLGFGRGSNLGDPAWDTRTQTTIDGLTRSALRMFYFCDYNWSFLHPMATIILDTNKNTIPLPDDYGGVEGIITVAQANAIVWTNLDFVGMPEVYQLQSQYPTQTGRPMRVCEEPLKGTTGTQSNRSQLRVWPIADQQYQLKFTYYILPDYLTGAQPYAYGGAEHFETLLSAAKAASERDLDDMINGPQWQNFERQLEISKNQDRRRKPQTLGYNRDLSDYRDRRLWRPEQHGWSPITVNGVQY
jgi:hypothetical protein